MTRHSPGQNFWRRLDRFPPILCRLLARQPRGRPLTTAEISAASGLTEVGVFTVSNQTDWKGIDIYTMRRFTEACGVDITSRSEMTRVESYLRKRPNWRYLRRDPQWHTYFQPLIKLWLATLK